VRIKLLKVLTLKHTPVRTCLSFLFRLSRLPNTFVIFLLVTHRYLIMSVCAVRVRLRGMLKSHAVPIAEIPAFLCPGLLNTTNLSARNTHWKHSQVSSPRPSQRFLTTQTEDSSGARTPDQIGADARYEYFAHSTLPKACPGCGALSQSVLQDEPGYYNITRKSVRKYVSGTAGTGEAAAVEEEIIRNALANAGNIVAGLHFGKREKEPPRTFINTELEWNEC
jgi:hypothetical protein